MIFDTLLRPEATTRMSRRPNLVIAVLTMSSQLASELGRLAMISALPPSATHSAATFLSSSVLLAASTTCAPAPASTLAASAPKAPEAPVTIAVLPRISNKASGFLRKSSNMGGVLGSVHQSIPVGVRASLRRRGNGDQHGDDIVAAIDDLAVFVG